MPKAIDEKYLTVKAARETTVFYVSTKNNKIEHTSLMRHIMMNAKKINKYNKNKRTMYHICINNKYCNHTFDTDFKYEEEIHTIELCKMITTSKSICLHKFENLEYANNELLRYIYQNEYLINNKIHNECFFTLSEAEDKFDEYYAEQNNINLLVSKSILRKQRIIYKIRTERENERVRLRRERLNKESEEFINLIDNNENETLKQTVERLIETIGYTVEKDVLYAAAKRIRGE